MSKFTNHYLTYMHRELVSKLVRRPSIALWPKYSLVCSRFGEMVGTILVNRATIQH